MKCCKRRFIVVLVTLCVVQLLGQTGASHSHQIDFSVRDVDPVYRVRCSAGEPEFGFDPKQDIICISLNITVPNEWTGKICQNKTNISHETFKKSSQRVVGYRGMTAQAESSFFEVFILDCCHNLPAFNCSIYSTSKVTRESEADVQRLKPVAELTCCVGDNDCGNDDRVEYSDCEDTGSSLPGLQDKSCNIMGRIRSISIRQKFNDSWKPYLTNDDRQIISPNNRSVNDQKDVGLVFCDRTVSDTGAKEHCYVFTEGSDVQYICSVGSYSNDCDKSLRYEPGKRNNLCKTTSSQTQEGAKIKVLRIVVAVLVVIILVFVAAIIVCCCCKRKARRGEQSSDQSEMTPFKGSGAEEHQNEQNSDKESKSSLA